jgi:hypothetical protein
MDKIEVLRAKGYTYLIHVSRKENLEKMIQTSQKINTYYERYILNVNPKGIYSISEQSFDIPFEIPISDFPGIFFHLVSYTMDELENKYKNSNPDVMKMVFPLELLLQKNWHYKINDKNGIIDNDTYFHHNMELIPSMKEIKDYYESNNKYYIGNEVVFHDGIHLSNCLKIFTNVIIENPISYQLNLDLCRKPFYVYYSDRKYDGIEISFYKSDLTMSTNEFYIDFIQKHLPNKYKYLCENVTTKEELENRIYNTKVNGFDLFTYLYIFRNCD